MVSKSQILHIPSKMTIFHVTLFMLVASLGNDHVEVVVFINEKEKNKGFRVFLVHVFENYFPL